ncbi:MAG: hypothetical protein J6X80_00140 [Lachnospiraceae bacterium]|nr:hypothetical protein [Lachnospiraceae bacterium]
MGRNLQATPIRTSYQKKLAKFTSSLGKAISEGETIPFADNDLAYTISLQNERIKEKGLEFEYEVTRRNPEETTFYDTADWKDRHYASSVGFGLFKIKRTVKKDGKQLYKDTLRNEFFGTVTDIVSGSHPDNEVHICPNCGADGTIAELQNGCPYCGTQYKMDDLFPKVTGYYFSDSLGITRKQLAIGWPVCAFFCTILSYIFIFNQQLQDLIHIDIAYDLKSKLLFGPFAGVAYGFLLFLFMHLLFKIARAIVDLKRMGTIEADRRFESRMKKISPEFSHEYFKSKAISLIKTAVYSKDERELPCYKGEALPAEMKDIIDLNYAGTFGLKEFKEENNIVTVHFKAYFDVLSIKDNKVSFTHPVFDAIFKRRTDIPVNMNFSMTRISCPTCGKSFNAMKNKICPGCGNEYELISDDWVLAELKQSK